MFFLLFTLKNSHRIPLKKLKLNKSKSTNNRHHRYKNNLLLRNVFRSNLKHSRSKTKYRSIYGKSNV